MPELAKASSGVSSDLTDADRRQIADHALDETTVLCQLEHLRHPPSPVDLDRPARLGDGILVLPQARHGELLALYDEASAAGRFSRFVPASGAASRMFKALAAVLAGEGSADDLAFSRRFHARLDDFPFHDELAAAVAERGGDGETLLSVLLSALLDADGLAFAERPKGLIPFHRSGGENGEEIRTPFDEHLVEAAAHLRDGSGCCRVHFTVLEEHEPLFRERLEQLRPKLEERFDVRFEIDFSQQDPSTDTVAAALDGGPFRDDDGRLLFRPGGHGALLDNLGRLDGDLVFIKNIDNVVPDARREAVVTWKKLLGGLLVELEMKLTKLLERAEKEGDQGGEGFVDDALTFLAENLGAPVDPAALPGEASARRAHLVDRLERPLRVCGMVPVAGEPGGGPFWVRSADGSISLQIVEGAQIDTECPDQAEILARSTHFNPVDLVCRLRDHHDHPFDLARYVDPEAVFVAQKFHQGRPLLALEHPGLWNGAMAAWNTVFVEVPAATFAPVKTVLDLLRPEHQGET